MREPAVRAKENLADRLISEALSLGRPEVGAAVTTRNWFNVQGFRFKVRNSAAGELFNLEL
jgi:hypothetical protein